MNQNSLNRFGKNLLKLFSRKAPASDGCSDIHYLEELGKQSRKISSELDKAIAQQDKREKRLLELENPQRSQVSKKGNKGKKKKKQPTKEESAKSKAESIAKLKQELAESSVEIDKLISKQMALNAEISKTTKDFTRSAEDEEQRLKAGGAGLSAKMDRLENRINSKLLKYHSGVAKPRFKRSDSPKNINRMNQSLFDLKKVLAMQKALIEQNKDSLDKTELSFLEKEADCIQDNLNYLIGFTAYVQYELARQTNSEVKESDLFENLHKRAKNELLAFEKELVAVESTVNKEFEQLTTGDLEADLGTFEDSSNVLKETILELNLSLESSQNEIAELNKQEKRWTERLDLAKSHENAEVAEQVMEKIELIRFKHVRLIEERTATFAVKQRLLKQLLILRESEKSLRSKLGK